MNDEQIERLIDALEQIASNTEAISDSLAALSVDRDTMESEVAAGGRNGLSVLVRSLNHIAECQRE